MQARLGLPPLAVDGDRIGRKQGPADRLRGGAKFLDGAIADQLGQARIAIAGSNLPDRSDNCGEAGFRE